MGGGGHKLSSNGARNSSIGIYALPTGIRKCLIWTDSGLVSPKTALTQALWGRVSTKRRPWLDPAGGGRYANCGLRKEPGIENASILLPNA